MEVRLPERGLVQVSGGIERGVSWALQFVSGTRRAQVRAGAWSGARCAVVAILASLPAEPGLEIGGTFDSLRFEDWFPGRSAGGGGQASADDLIRKIDIQADRFAILGRVFPEARIDARRAGKRVAGGRARSVCGGRRDGARRPGGRGADRARHGAPLAGRGRSRQPAMAPPTRGTCPPCGPPSATSC